MENFTNKDIAAGIIRANAYMLEQKEIYSDPEKLLEVVQAEAYRLYAVGANGGTEVDYITALLLHNYTFGLIDGLNLGGSRA